MNENVKIVFGLLGGLAMFLYGMNNMSDSLQKAAGEKMKKILGFLTKNPIMGAVAGAVVTSVLQSSSATTVMVIGFVSAGLMPLPQAISVIFGANIGTTMTAQLMAFKISNYIYPIIFIGFILNFVSKKEKMQNIGLVIFSFGLLFEGIEIMGGVMKPLAGSAFFIDTMARVKEMPVLGLGLGTLMTLVVQSSSATIAVLQNFASQAGPDGVTSVIGLTGAIPILLGDNIGTTITALLASIGQSKNAKRTAIAHSIFNISGSIVCMCIIPAFANFVRYISPKGNEIDVISRQIANAHTTFNLVCTLVWLPLIPIMVKIVTTIIRGEDKNETSILKPQFLDNNVLSQPAAALYLVSQEIERLSNYVVEIIDFIKIGISEETDFADETFTERKSAVKSIQSSISEYITKLFSGGYLTEKQAEQTAGLLFVTNNIERISDRCSDIASIFGKMNTDGDKMSQEAVKELENCIDILKESFAKSMEAVKNGNIEAVNYVAKARSKIKKAQKQLNKAHLARVKKKMCNADRTTAYSELLYNIDRISDNCSGIAEEAVANITFANIENDEKEEK